MDGDLLADRPAAMPGASRQRRHPIDLEQLSFLRNLSTEDGRNSQRLETLGESIKHKTRALMYLNSRKIAGNN